MNRGNLNRNGFLVLGLCFGLFLASAAQCEFKEKSDLNGYKQKSNSDRGPSNSSGSNDGSGYSNADGSNGRDNDRKKAIEEGIEIVTEALRAMQGQVSGYEKLRKKWSWFYRRDFLYYKACGSLFIELDKDLWCPPENLSDNSSSWEKLCYYVRQGNSSEVLKILGFRSEKKQTATFIWEGMHIEAAVDDDDNKDTCLKSLSESCLGILQRQDSSQNDARNNAQERYESSLLEFREAFKLAYGVDSKTCGVYSKRVDPYFRWEPGNDLDQLVKNLDNIQSGLVKIFGDEFINFDQKKFRDLGQGKSYWFWRNLADFFSSQWDCSLWFLRLSGADYDDMIALAKKLPDLLEPVN